MDPGFESLFALSVGITAVISGPLLLLPQYSLLAAPEIRTMPVLWLCLLSVTPLFRSSYSSFVLCLAFLQQLVTKRF